MRDFRDAKAMAKHLRQALAGRGFTLSHSEALELVAGQFGLGDWNLLAARIGAEAGEAAVPRFERAIPVLRIFSVDKAREFYLGFLGFEIDWEHRFEPGLPLFMQISRAGLLLHLSEHHGDASPGATVNVPMVGIDAYRAELIGKQYGYGRPGIEEQPWGMREMTVHDPFGNRIRFMERADRSSGPPRAGR